MKRLPFTIYSGPLVALGFLVAIACLAGSLHINNLQANLARAVRHDAAGMEAAVDLQVQLRHLRVHSLVLFSEPTEHRRQVVRDDLERVSDALADVRATASTPEDADLAKRIAQDYERYKSNLKLDAIPPAAAGSGSEVAQWSDLHHMRDLLLPCRELADRQQERMEKSLERSEVQTVWAGRVLFGLGFAGVLAGILSGFATARAMTQRVAQLSIRVQAVQARLDQEVGALTVQAPPIPGDLDEQLDRVVEHVSAACQRLQDQERDLLRAEQLAAVGQLAAGVAHEVRNPLTGVKTLLQAAVRAQNPTPLTPERLHLLLQEVARIERTVQGLVDFAHAPPPDRRMQDIRPIVVSAFHVAQSRADLKSIAIDLHQTAEPLPAAIDRDQLLSVLTNLLINAIESTPSGGEVCLSIERRDDEIIQVTVSDNGPGIDPAVADKLFTPFATTKPTGTGLGLTIARKMAREHGGELTVANGPAGGAC
ncbi:MAG TPA: ATP-binding protein, partial [Planctomycetaceae bacterium]|nr:ATP-binding protein [Planctomycetaceae bacterium]